MTFITQKIIDCNPRHSRRVSLRYQNRGLKKENWKNEKKQTNKHKKNQRQKQKNKGNNFPYYRIRKMTVFATF